MFADSTAQSRHAIDARREGRALAHTAEGRDTEANVCAVVEACIGRRWDGHRVRFFPIPDDIEGDLLTREGL